MSAGASLEGWLPLALTETVREGSWQPLRLVGSLDGADVPESVLPRDERFDWRAHARESERYVARIRKTFVDGRASGLPVWPPIAGRP